MIHSLYHYRQEKSSNKTGKSQKSSGASTVEQQSKENYKSRGALAPAAQGSGSSPASN
jgi:hypothetical protein